MATETLTRLVDDLDGGKAERTVLFSWDGTDYAIDLSKRNIAALEKALAPYLAAARRVPGRSAAGRRRRTPAPPGRAGRSDPRAVREWARANGHEVSDRGRIGADILTAYDASR